MRGENTNEREYKEMKKLVALLLALSMAVALCGCMSEDYKKAVSLFEYERFDDAQAVFEELGDYKDSRDQVKNCKYQKAMKMIEQHQYRDAQTVLEELEDYRDCKVKLCEVLINQIGYLSKYDPSYSSISAAERALSYYESLDESEKSQVANRIELPTKDEIAEVREIRQRKDAEKRIEEAVLADSVKTIKNYLNNPSSYQERTDRESRVSVLWDEEDPTKVHGLVDVYFSALNNLGGRIDSHVSGIWTGTYKNGTFTLESSSVGTSMMLEALR